MDSLSEAQELYESGFVNEAALMIHRLRLDAEDEDDHTVLGEIDEMLAQMRSHLRARELKDFNDRVLDGPIQDDLLMSLKGSIVATGESRPNRVRIYADRVEETNPGFPGRRRVQTIRFEQVAQVALKRGLMWSGVVIESRGGAAIRVDGLSRKEADAKALIDERLAALQEPSRARTRNEAEPGRSGTVSAEIERLAELRDRGILTEDEFQAAKRGLLGLD